MNDSPWVTQAKANEKWLSTSPTDAQRKHRSLYGDFFATIDAALTVGGHLTVEPEDLANRLVHLVVLHGLLPETEPATTENQA